VPLLYQVPELKLRAERRLGELLEETVDHTGGGNRKSVSQVATPILDLPEGITRTQSSRWQLLFATKIVGGLHP